MPPAKKPTDAPLTDSGALYSPRDFKAGTDAVEKDTDSAWALWLDANRSPEEIQSDPRYAQTAPQSLSTEPAALARTGQRPSPGRLAPATVEEAMVEARRKNRVCPRPNQWQALYDMLPDKKKNKPSAPLIGTEWNTSSSINKRTCLREQLEWAAASGTLDDVLTFLESLPEAAWFHMNE